MLIVFLVWLRALNLNCLQKLPLIQSTTNPTISKKNSITYIQASSLQPSLSLQLAIFYLVSSPP